MTDIPIPKPSYRAILATGAQFLLRHFPLIAGIHAVLFIPAFAALDITEWLSFNLDQNFLEANPDGEAPFNTADIVGTLLLLFSMFVLWPLSYAATMVAVHAIVENRPVTISSALQVAWAKFPGLFVVLLWSCLYLIGGFILLVIPAIYFYVRFLLAYQVVAVEDISGRSALRRSGELLTGRMWMAFFIAATLIAMSALAVLIAVLLPMGPAYVLFDTLIQTLICAFDASVTAVLYLSCRNHIPTR